jgi:hypothetical protein
MTNCAAMRNFIITHGNVAGRHRIDKFGRFKMICGLSFDRSGLWNAIFARQNST